MKKHQGYGSAMLDFRFEAAHRQPALGGKCRNLHGHTWRLSVTLCNDHHVGGVNDMGLSVEFGMVKNIIRDWIDRYFDHATLLGMEDPLVHPLLQEGCKLFLFGEMPHASRHTTGNYYEPLPWPSVEAVAFCLGERLSELVKTEIGSYVAIEGIMLSETDTNSFSWIAPGRIVGENYSDSPTAQALRGEVMP